MTDQVLMKPEQYADLIIRDIEQAHLAKKDDFLGVAVYRDQIIEQMKAAILAAYNAGEKVAIFEYEKKMMEAMKDDGSSPAL